MHDMDTNDIGLTRGLLGNGNQAEMIFMDYTSQIRRAVDRTGIQLPRGK
jgi:hypothetical protein